MTSPLAELEQRIESRLDALLSEQRRLARRQAEVAQREQWVREKLREIEAGGHAEPQELEETRALLRDQQARLARDRVAHAQRTAEVEQREQELRAELDAERAALADSARAVDEREAALVERLEAVAARELALARHAAQVTAREQALAAQPAAAPEPPALEPEPVRAPEPPPVPASPLQEPAPTGPSFVNLPMTLDALQRMVDENADRFPAQADEWRSYLFFLRDFAGLDGSLPPEFEGLVRDVFGDLFD